MLRFTLFLLLVFAVPLFAWAECTDCPDAAKERCSCSEFHRYTGDAQLAGINVSIKAESASTDDLTLLIRDDYGHKVAMIPLTGPHNGEHVYSFKLTTDVAASSIRQAVLVNNSDNDVKISYMLLTGIITGGEFVYFEKECPGVVIGANGCQRMVLYQADKSGSAKAE